MLRAYAIGMGAGTQVLTLMAGAMIVGPPSELSRVRLIGAAWVINLAVAEWIIRRRPTLPTRVATAVISQRQSVQPEGSSIASAVELPA